MHVGIDARYLNDSYSGVTRYSENLLEALARCSPDHRFTVFIHRSFNHRLHVGDNFEVVPCNTVPLSPFTWSTFAGQVRRRRCDFLHCLFPMAPLWGIRRNILTLHDIHPFLPGPGGESGFKKIHHGMNKGFFRLVFPRLVQRATWFIAVSQATKDRMAQMYPEMEHKTIVVHSGVEDFYFERVNPNIRSLAQKRLEIPPRYLLYVGNAQPHKNVPAMIRAFHHCQKRYPDQVGDMQFLLVIGRDQHAHHCRKVIEEFGLGDHVRLLGPVTEEEKRVLYEKATLLFYVTRSEGFGFPILEAQASGLPVLASDDASAPEITRGSATLVSPDDEDAMLRSLTHLLLEEGRLEEMREKGIENARNFSWDRTAQAILQIYELLL